MPRAAFCGLPHSESEVYYGLAKMQNGLRKINLPQAILPILWNSRVT